MQRRADIELAAPARRSNAPTAVLCFADLSRTRHRGYANGFQALRNKMILSRDLVQDSRYLLYTEITHPLVHLSIKGQDRATS
jgi:hypothetical protein